MKDKAELIAAGLPEDEAWALLGIAFNAEGAVDLKRFIIPAFHDAIDRLAAKGIIEQQWMISPEGRDLLGLKSGD